MDIIALKKKIGFIKVTSCLDCKRVKIVENKPYCWLHYLHVTETNTCNDFNKKL